MKTFVFIENNVDLKAIDLHENIDNANFDYETMQKIVNNIFAIFHVTKTRDLNKFHYKCKLKKNSFLMYIVNENSLSNSRFVKN